MLYDKNVTEVCSYGSEYIGSDNAYFTVWTSMS